MYGRRRKKDSIKEGKRQELKLFGRAQASRNRKGGRMAAVCFRDWSARVATSSQKRPLARCTPDRPNRREGPRTSSLPSHHRKYTRRWCISTSSPPHVKNSDQAGNSPADRHRTFYGIRSSFPRTVSRIQSTFFRLPRSAGRGPQRPAPPRRAPSS